MNRTHRGENEATARLAADTAPLSPIDQRAHTPRTAKDTTEMTSTDQASTTTPECRLTDLIDHWKIDTYPAADLMPSTDAMPAFLADLDTVLRDLRGTRRALDETIGERDHAEGAADRLAYAIAPVSVIGEHSSGNDPWANALDVIQESDPAQGVYRERAHLVAHLAALYPSHIGYTDPAEPDWAVVIIETTAGQLSWHIAPGDMGLFGHVQASSRICRGWDGHSTDEKYRRLRELTAASEMLPLTAPAVFRMGDTVEITGSSGGFEFTGRIAEMSGTLVPGGEPEYSFGVQVAGWPELAWRDLGDIRHAGASADGYRSAYADSRDGELADLRARIAAARAEIREQSVRNHAAECGSPVNALVERVLAAVETHLVDPQYRPGGETAQEGPVAPVSAAQPSMDAPERDGAQRGAAGRDGATADRSEP